MKKSLMRMSTLILAVLLLTDSTAFAAVSRGDRGDEVYDLQQLLFETGWLFEDPDGIFGKRTEEAVKGFEEYANLPVDGIADDQMIYELCVSLEALNEECNIVSDYSYEENGGADFADCCIEMTEVDGSVRTDYCEKHHNLHTDTYDMLTYGDIASVCMASDMWYEEVVSLYDTWAALVPEEESGAIYANRATFLATIEAQRAISNMGIQSEEKTMQSETGICKTLRNQAAWICHQIWEQQNSVYAAEDSISQQAIVLNSSVIIDGEMIYYSGAPEGEDHGVFAMYADGTERIKLSDIEASLKAASNGNLLVWHYDDNGYAALEVLRMDGSLEKVGYGNAHAIAKDGRFYYGGSSVAEDGSDHQWLLSSDPEFHDNYYPVDVVDGYLYYLDTNGGSLANSEGNVLPSGDVELNRLNLETGEIQLLSGAGTCYLGIEDGMLYYTREDFEVYDYESGGSFLVEVEEGLYSMNLEVLAETQIAEISDDLLTFEYYMFVDDEVIYGEFSDYNPDEPVYKVLRRQANGNELPALETNGNEIRILCVNNGVLYGIQTDFTEYDESYTYDEYIVMYDLGTGAQMRIAMEENEAMTYTEMSPRIAVENGRIYYYVQDSENGAEALKSAALNGDDVITLVKSEPLY